MTDEPKPAPDCPSCRTLIAELRVLREVVERQGAEIERLKAKKPKTSRTSSKPPSSDGPWFKDRDPKKPSGTSRGAQPGHAPKTRKPAPPDGVDDVTRHADPGRSQHIGRVLSASVPDSPVFGPVASRSSPA